MKDGGTEKEYNGDDCLEMVSYMYRNVVWNKFCAHEWLGLSQANPCMHTCVEFSRDEGQEGRTITGLSSG